MILSMEAVLYWMSPSGRTAARPAPTSRSEVWRWRQKSPVPCSGLTGSQAMSPAAAITGSAAASAAEPAITATLAARMPRRRRSGGILGRPLERQDRRAAGRGARERPGDRIAPGCRDDAVGGTPLDRRDREVVERVEARAGERRGHREREVDRADDQVVGVRGRDRGRGCRGRGGVPLTGRGVERAGRGHATPLRYVGAGEVRGGEVDRDARDRRGARAVPDLDAGVGAREEADRALGPGVAGR